MSEIARRDSLNDKIEWSKTLAVANLLPREYQNNPGNLLYAVEYADSLGIDRINAITSIHVIGGKPSASADLIASLVRKAGHKLRVSGDDTHAVAQIIRADDPDFTFEARWDEAKATTAGLWGKGNWKHYPAAMLRARAITEVARSAASDALYGVSYTPEELGAQVDADGAPVTKVVSQAPDDTATVGDARDVLETALDMAGAARNGDGITGAQSKKLHALATELGLSREVKLAGASRHAGREIASTTELTKAEAARVIDALEAKAESVAELAAAAEVVEAELVYDADSEGES